LEKDLSASKNQYVDLEGKLKESQSETSSKDDKVMELKAKYKERRLEKDAELESA